MAIKTEEQLAIPQTTIAKLNRFERMVESVRTAPTTAHASARIKLAYRAGAELSRHSDELVSRMEKGQRWLNSESNKGHASYVERENQWLSWLSEYEAVQDALIAAKGVI